MASDITLAVGDGARRMTYAELADVRGVSPASAKRLAQRHHWGQQTGNDGVVRVTVPLSALVKPAQTKEKNVADKQAMSPATGAADPATPVPVIHDVAGAVIPATDVLARAVEALREQLVRADEREESARRRAARAEREVEETRRRIDELHTALAGAVAAERIAAGEAGALRTIVAGLRARPWWRRWFRG